MPRPRRRLRIAFVALLLPFVILCGVLRHFLDRQRLAGMVAERLEAAYGGHVEIRAANIGLTGSDMADLRLYEVGAESGTPPWMTVERVRTDLSAWNVLCGERKPRTLTLEGAALTLRLDEAGHLLSSLPKPGAQKESLPRLQITHGQVILRQQGRPEFIVTGVDGTLADDGTHLKLRGAIDDPTWGKWPFSGELAEATAVMQFNMIAPAMHVTQSMLDRLPFVPALTWRHVQCEGDTPVRIEVSHLPLSQGAPGQFTRDGFHYKITLDPVATSVYVTRIDLHAEQAKGRVIIADKVVYLENVEGLAADGEIKTAGKLDFRMKPTQMEFTVETKQIDLQKLPLSWRLPAQVTQKMVSGRVNGRADLRLAIVDGKARTSGDGAGAITDTRVLGIPFKKPIKLSLHADGNGFAFQIPGLPVSLGVGRPRREPATPMSLPKGDPRP
jgi:hypothetical protein